MATLRSIWIWCAISILILLWLPLHASVWLFDRDPVKYRTGRWFRRLGVAMTKVNPAWRIHIIDADRVDNPRTPYVVVSNHQSHADIPIISHLPWEMKWIGKKELFSIPLIGWMMWFARDIPVDRTNRRSGAAMLLRCLWMLERKCSVMFFPEGTRSPNGLVGKFNDGAFQLAIKAGVPILPVAVEGSYDCLPKKTWRFGAPTDIYVKVLPPISSAGYTSATAGELRDNVRTAIMTQVASWRGVDIAAVDHLKQHASQG